MSENYHSANHSPDQEPLLPKDKIALLGLALVLSYVVVGNALVVIDSFRDKIQIP